MDPSLISKLVKKDKTGPKIKSQAGDSEDKARQSILTQTKNPCQFDKSKNFTKMRNYSKTGIYIDMNTLRAQETANQDENKLSN